MCEKGETKNLSQTEYFQNAEVAIKEYLVSTDTKRKNDLMAEIISPAIKKLVSGVKRMPKFQKINGISLEELEEGAYYHVIFQLSRFNPDKIGKGGNSVKAFSYFGTCIKNYYLGIKIQTDKKIAKYGGPLDINDVKIDIPQNSRDFTKFEDLKLELIKILKFLPSKTKLTKNDLIVINHLRYILENWHALEFQDKNEFMRLLVNYTHLSPTVVDTSMKKIRFLTQKHTTNLRVSSKKKKYAEIDDYKDLDIETYDQNLYLKIKDDN